MVKCVVCRSRKGKRNCPALGEVICTQCCGSKKEKEIDCPLDCFYLNVSKQYFSDRQESHQLSNFTREMKSIIGNESHYLDILQNIEFVITNIYKEQGNICDKDVELALDYLMEMGKAQLELPSKFLVELPSKVQFIVDSVDDILEFRDSFGIKEDLITKLKCVYCVLNSVRTHYNQGDKYSYLDFISPLLT